MMAYTKKQFGLELKEKIVEGSNSQEISKWAFKVYTDHGLNFEDGLDYFVLKLVAMEEGPEFSLSKDDLILLANELAGINDKK
jgi:hypothetical protein